MAIVSNSSPLILFSKSGRLDLLHALFSEVLIPRAVFGEVVTAGAGRPGVVEISAMSWIEVRPLAGRDVVEELASRLGRGEAEAIALARELRGTTRLLIDDRLGRGVANEMGLSIGWAGARNPTPAIAATRGDHPGSAGVSRHRHSE